MGGARFHATVDKTGWVKNDGEPKQPVVRLHFSGDRRQLVQILFANLRRAATSEDIELSFRVLPPRDGPQRGILSFSDQVTGAYLTEVELEARAVEALSKAVRAYATQTEHDSAYQVEIRTPTSVVTVFETDLLAVYDTNGTLLRRQSLLPTGIGL